MSRRPERPLPGRVRRLFRLERLLHTSGRRELDDELSFHFETTVEELMRGGMDRRDAEAEAERRFGDLRRWRGELERIDRETALRRRAGEWLASRRDDLRQAARALVRAPLFTAGVVLTFALGIGANATMFGILDRLFLSPPAHVEEPEEVRRVLVDRFVDFRGERDTGPSLSYPDYADLRDAGARGAVGAFAPRGLIVGRGADAMPVEATLATASFLVLLGVRPALGRFFTPEEDAIGAPGVVVLGHGLWQRRFGGSPDVLGQTLDFGAGPYTIVGVAPEGFTGVDLRPMDLWLPLHTAQAALNGPDWETSRGWWWLQVVARLAPGVAIEGAEAEATALHRAGRAEEVEAGHYDRDVRIVAAPLQLARGPLAGGDAKVAAWLAGVSLIVLLVACANVANLLLARALRRRRETGVRLALGISRLRLLGQTLTESLLLATLGALAALGVARFGGALVRRVLLPDVAWTDSAVGPRVLAFVALATLAAGLFSGLLPAWQAGRQRVAATLGASSRTATEASHARRFLTLAQAALSVVLLVGAGLFVRSLDRVHELDMGFEARELLLVRPIGVADAEEKKAVFQRLEHHLAGAPGVRATALTVGLPFWSSWAVDLRVPGLDSIPTPKEGGPYIITGGAHYFETMGLSIVRGRGFTSADDAQSAAPVVVVNAAMAHGIWPGEEAVGKCMVIGGEGEPCYPVIGVVENARRDAIVENENWLYYIPQGQSDRAPEALLVRVEGDPGAAAERVRRSVLAAEGGLRYADVRPLQELLAPQARSWELGATLFTLFGLLALAVAGIGLYSVLAFDVAQRTRELGIRTALGASREGLLALVMGQGLRVTLAGLALGGVAAWLLAPLVQDLLFETTARDPTVFAGVGVVLLLVAALASGVPALRATRVDPREALRAE